jgi:hypothetical protein
MYARSVSGWFRGFREMVSSGLFLDRFRPAFCDLEHTAGAARMGGEARSGENTKENKE